MKIFYRINKFLVLLICFIFDFSYPCKISRQLEYKLFSPDESVVNSAISSDGGCLIMSIKKFPDSFVVAWGLQEDLIIYNYCTPNSCKYYIPNSYKEIKFSQNNHYVGFNWGNWLNIKETHGKKIEYIFNTHKSDTYICGFDISENFESLVYYDSAQNIYFYNLKKPANPIASFKEPDAIRSVRFITQKTGSGVLAVETLYAVKFYDILSCKLKSIYTISKIENIFRPFCGICVDDGCYAAFSSMAEDGNLETEIYLSPTDEEKTSKKYSNFSVYNNLQTMAAPQCTADPDVILFTGRRKYGEYTYEQVNLFSISKNKQINFKLFNTEMEIAKYYKLLTPESLQNDAFFLKLSAQFTSNKQLIIHLKSNSTNSCDITYAIFIDIDFDSDVCNFQVMYYEKTGKFYLARL